jgi:predicted nucleotidyltransferase
MLKRVRFMRKFRDRDFLRTKEGFLFCVVGPYHPPNRVISYLKYVPAKLGSWGKGIWRFKRVMRNYTIPSLLETFKLLEKEYPHYLFYSPFYNILMTAVPSEYVAKHYKPEEKLAQLQNAKRLDALQKKVVRFVSFLSEKSNVPTEFFGVTGSILLNIHRMDVSDIDLTVYGLKNSLAVKQVLQPTFSQKISKIKRLEGSALNAWCRKKASIFPLTFDEALHVYKRKWNLGIFEDTEFSVHPVKLEEEVNEEYADKMYDPLGSVVLGAVVVENTDSLFLPAVYRIQDARVIKGAQVADIEEVVTYEGLYGDIAEIGESILVKGKLELVHDKKNRRKYHRIVVGSPEGKGTEYIKPI